MLLTVSVGCYVASWKFVVKKATSYLSALRTILLEELHFVTAVTVHCGSFSATSLLWWLLMREASSAKSATFTVSGTTVQMSLMYSRSSSGDRIAPSAVYFGI